MSEESQKCQKLQLDAKIYRETKTTKRFNYATKAA